MHDFGVLKHELKSVERKKVSANSFGRFQLVMFENHVVALALTEEVMFSGKLSKFGKPIETVENVKRYVRQIRDFSETIKQISF